MLPKPYFQDSAVTIYHGDCRDIIPYLSGAQLVATDPPYNGVVSNEWDNQWPGDREFLEWLGGIARGLCAAMVDNSTIYTFCSPRLAAAVELEMAKSFNVIASAVWDKGDARQGVAGSGVDITSLRTFWSSGTERVVIAEKPSNAPPVFGEYLKAEIKRAGATNKQIAALFPSKSGGLTGCVSNWLLGYNVPTREQYATIQAKLGGGFLVREYDALLQDYEKSRRPFFLTENDQWGQIWRFGIEQSREHPTQKPLSLMSHILRVSSRHGELVLDPFMGSGTTLRAAKDLGRRAIGIEREEKYCEVAARRMGQEVLPLFAA